MAQVDESIHYAALVRLQAAMSALQDMLHATSSAARPGQLEQARENAQAAVEIALGTRREVPEHLMRNWADAEMKRNASSALAA